VHAADDSRISKFLLWLLVFQFVDELNKLKGGETKKAKKNYKMLDLNSSRLQSVMLSGQLDS